MQLTFVLCMIKQKIKHKIVNCENIDSVTSKAERQLKIQQFKFKKRNYSIIYLNHENPEQRQRQVSAPSTTKYCQFSRYTEVWRWVTHKRSDIEFVFIEHWYNVAYCESKNDMTYDTSSADNKISLIDEWGLFGPADIPRWLECISVEIHSVAICSRSPHLFSQGSTTRREKIKKRIFDVLFSSSKKSKCSFYN